MRTKFIIIILVVLSNSTALLFASNGAEILINVSRDPIKQKNAELMSKRIATIKWQVVEFNKESLQTNNAVMNFLELSGITLQRDKIDIRNPDDFTWYGSNKTKNYSGIFSIQGSNVRGTITVGLRIFELELLDSQYILVEIDQRRFPPEGCGDFNELPNNVVQPLRNDGVEIYNQLQPQNQSEHSAHLRIGGLQKHTITAVGTIDCKMRVLVLYTTAAVSAVGSGNLQTHAQNSIATMNLANSNSAVSFEAELVYVGQTSYTEVGYFTDVPRFRINGDGYMDEVHALREEFSADICVLMSNNTDYCGLAAGIKTCEDFGFCAVYWDCAISNYSFAHEIAHLFGCRHNTEADATNAPYADAHGYRDISNGWRTIMAYQSSPATTRIAYWSNPSINYSGNPMGTTATHNNARILNTYWSNTMNFRPINGERVIVQADITGANHFTYNAGFISTTGSLSIASSSDWSFLAGQGITMSDGFIATAGSDFLARIVPACGTPDGESCNQYNTAINQVGIADNKYEVGISLSPNPASENVKITVRSQSSGIISYRLIDILGRTISTENGTMASSDYQKDITLNGLSSGSYTIVVYINDVFFSKANLVKL
ncbi:MAG: zinc-dependent metalloprotease [Bacteroidetes bacterium]|nr:zinc-dependent metalloprotease [Bacteroidota bacterium]